MYYKIIRKNFNEELDKKNTNGISAIYENDIIQIFRKTIPNGAIF